MPWKSALVWLFLSVSTLPIYGEDWPMFRHDRSRSAVSGEKLSLPLELGWTFRSRQARNAPKFSGDVNREITPEFNRFALPMTAAGGSVFFTSAADGRAVCLDAASGKPRWQFLAGAAVNRAPTYSDGRVYFGSDDGCAYCLDAKNGEVVWKFKAAPHDRWLFSFDALSSVWPVRSDVLVDGGVAYFGAGIFPHDGSFLYALDARSGQLLWRNDTHCENNSRWPLSPNGHIYASKVELYIPMDFKPFRWATFLAFRRADGSYDPWASKDPEHVRQTDGHPFPPFFGAVKDGIHYLGNDAQDAAGKRLWSVPTPPYTTDFHSVQGMDVVRGAILRYDPDLCSVAFAGGTVYHVTFATNAKQGVRGKVFARDARDGKELWSAEIAEWPNQVIVANGRLLVGTRSGTIYCFAPQGLVKHGTVEEEIATTSVAEMSAAAETIVQQTGAKEGYGLVLDCESSALAQELAKRTNLHLCAVFADAEKADAARRELTKAGTYISRIHVWHQSAGTALPYPACFADLAVSESAVQGGPLPTDVQELNRILQPIRGVAWIGGKQTDAALKKWIKASGERGWQVANHGGLWATRTRPPLENAGGWTHAMGDAGNTMCSNDAALKPPLGVAWYGPPFAGRNDMGNPPPLISAGVLVSQDLQHLAGYDEYTGRRLWKRDDLVDTDAAASRDSVYLRFREAIARIDLLTGRTLKEYEPPFKGGQWDEMAVSDDGKTLFVSAHGKDWKCISALDVALGARSWTLGGPGEKKQWPTWNAISDGRIYILGGAAEPAEREQAIAEMRSWLATQDKKNRDAFEIGLAQRDFRKLTTLDTATGKVLYEHGVDLTNCGGRFVPPAPYGLGQFGRAYDPYVVGCVMAHDGVVVFATESGADKGWGVWPTGGYNQRALAVHDGATGKLLWNKPGNYRTRPVVADGSIYAEPWAYDLHTGAQKTREHPVTGVAAPWAWCRNDKQCGVFCGSTYFLFGRSRGVGYQDLLTDCGLYTFMDSRASCWVDVSSGGGMMIKPPYAMDCLCEISMPFTVAMGQVPTEPAEPQVFAQPGTCLPVKHLFLDFGATGDHRDKQGNLWLSPARPKTHPLILTMDIETSYYEGGGPVQRSAVFTNIENTDIPFVFATAARGIRKCVLPVTAPHADKGDYLVRLGFSALPGDKPGQRVFDVKLNGQTVLKDFDIVRESGKPDRAIWKEFLVSLEGNVTLEMPAKAEKPTPEEMPLLNGLEILRK